MANDEKSVWTRFSFEQTVEQLVNHGPSARVGIAAAGAKTASIHALALIDTGAAGTAISPRLAAKLDVQPIDKGWIHEAGREPITASVFHVRLFIPRMHIDLEVTGLPSLAEPHDVLIGRDILASFKLLIDFTSGVTQLHWKNDSD